MMESNEMVVMELQEQQQQQLANQKVQASNNEETTSANNNSPTENLVSDPEAVPKEPLSTRLMKAFSRTTILSPGRGNNDEHEAHHDDGVIDRLVRALSSSLSALRTPRQPEPDDADIPENFLHNCNGNRHKAQAKWDACKRWRLENKIDTCLERPHVKYEAIKTYYTQVLQGRGLDGEIVILEQPAKLDTGALRKNGVTPADMGMHIAICMEYIFKQVDTSPNAACFTIMDLKDLSISKAVSLDYLAIMKSTADTIEDYYPGKLKRVLIINPPRMFGTVLGVIKGALPASVRDGMEILYNNNDLFKYVDRSQLPKAYGGTGPEIGQAQIELDGRQFFLGRTT